MSEYAVDFTIAAADVNLLDTVPYKIVDLPSLDAVIRVPVRLEIHKAAGTIYTASFQPLVVRVEEYYKADPNIVDVGLGPQLIIRDTEGERVHFRLPLISVLATAAVTRYVAFPELSGLFWEGRNAFELVSTCPVSGGTGALSGRIFFENYTV